MKRVTVLIPDDVSEEQIYYFHDGSMTGVQAYIAPDRVGSSKEVVDNDFTPNFSGLSDEEIEKVNKHVKEAMRKSAIAPNGVGNGKDEEVCALTKKMSAEEIERFEKALKSAPIMPMPQEYLMPPFATRKEFEDLRRRVKALETKSEATVQRVTKSPN